MGLRDRVKKLASSTEDIDNDRLQERFRGVDVVNICEAPLREPVRISGEVMSIQIVPRAGSPSLEVTVGDGTAKAVAVFTGRRKIAGIHPGRGVVLEGVGGRVGNRLQLLNPAYTLLG
jgi:hypothetical protein